MKQTIIVGLTTLLLLGCGSNQEELPISNEEVNEKVGEELENLFDLEKMKEWPTQTYRSDGYRPSVASEWIKVVYSPDQTTINLILYWSSNNETPIELELIESKFENGEDTGWAGIVKSTDGFFEYGFGIVEDRFNLIFDDEGRMQEFIAEDV